LLTHERSTPEAFVLLHGLTASPGQFIDFGRRLHGEGANVLVPRMPRHGLSDRLTDELALLTNGELIAHARRAVALARGLGERVTVIGFSLGGLLAAWIAQNEAVDRVVLVAPFLNSVLVPHPAAEKAARFALSRGDQFVWWNPIMKDKDPKQPDHGYPRFTTHVVANAILLANEIFAEAANEPPRARTIVFMLNKGEMAVSNDTARRLAKKWKAHGTACILVREFDFPPSHDIIEPLADPRIAARAHDRLHRLLRADPHRPPGA
jgi:pimeloyl-ACP methyl ester carboxylesterase